MGREPQRRPATTSCQLYAHERRTPWVNETPGAGRQHRGDESASAPSRGRRHRAPEVRREGAESRQKGLPRTPRQPPQASTGQSSLAGLQFSDLNVHIREITWMS
jgi:hypothetical protein